VATIDLQTLLEPVSADAPCGDDLEYTGVTELERLAQGKPEQEIGGTFIPAQEPDWRQVRDTAVELTRRTRDLRVLVPLLRALVRTDGFPGLQGGVALMRGVLERYWDCLYPPIDPDDNDPTFRVNTLTALCDTDTMLRFVREAPVVVSRSLGRFSLRDLAIATGSQPPPKEGEPPTLAAIEAAFQESAVEALQGTAAAVAWAAQDLREIEALVTERLGAGVAPSLEPLRGVLLEAGRTLRQYLERRGVGLPSEPEAASAGEVAPAATGRPRAAAASGEVSGRDDVIRLLDAICGYYRQQEPSSPVPVLLQRARRLVPMDFLSIVRDLAPTGLAEVEAIRGPVEDQGEG
jgi:type VI secretion system protein ImpA